MFTLHKAIQIQARKTKSATIRFSFSYRVNTLRNLFSRRNNRSTSFRPKSSSQSHPFPRFRFSGTTGYNRSLHASSPVWASSYARSISSGTVRSSGPTVSSNSHPARASEIFPADRLQPATRWSPDAASCSSLRRSSLSPAGRFFSRSVRVMVYLDRR